jgi:hypothetical protein
MNKFFSLWKLCIERYKVARVGFLVRKRKRRVLGKHLRGERKG